MVMTCKTAGLAQLKTKLKTLADNVKAMQEKAAFIGVPKSEGSKPTQEGGFKMAELASVLSFGNQKRGLPPRPFLDIAVSDSHAFIDETIKDVLSHLEQAHATEQGLQRMATGVAGYCKDHVMGNDSKLTALHPNTIRRKGSSGVLIDTGALRSSIFGFVDSNQHEY